MKSNSMLYDCVTHAFSFLRTYCLNTSDTLLKKVPYLKAKPFIELGLNN